LDLNGIAYINWTISLYQVGAIVAGAAAAALCARWGIKRIFMGATLIYAGGCVLGAAAPSMGILVLGRLIQGMGGGMLLSLSYVAIEAWFAPELWGRLFAITATVWGGGSLLGPLIGGAFSGPHLWRGAFWAFTLQAIVLCALAALWMPATARKARAHRPLAGVALRCTGGGHPHHCRGGGRERPSGGVLTSIIGCVAGAALCISQRGSTGGRWSACCRRSCSTSPIRSGRDS